VGIDGAMVLMRPGEGGQARGEEPDPLDEKEARCRGREVKTAVVYRPKDRYSKSGCRRGLVARMLVSVLGSADEIFSRLWSTLVLSGSLGANTTVVIVGDGAKWIWERAKMFPRRIEILDFWHAAEHAWSCARMLWGEKSKQTKTWARDMVRRLRGGKVCTVIDLLDKLIKTLRRKRAPAIQVEAVKDLKDYYVTHASRMNYPSYRRQGLSIGSGAVESAHKQVGHTRMRQAGMRWSVRGARRMVELRLLYLKADWHEWESFVSRSAA
jgi:hypothetical protein